MLGGGKEGWSEGREAKWGKGRRDEIVRRMKSAERKGCLKGDRDGGRPEGGRTLGREITSERNRENKKDGGKTGLASEQRHKKGQ